MLASSRANGSKPASCLWGSHTWHFGFPRHVLVIAVATSFQSIKSILPNERASVATDLDGPNDQRYGRRK